MKIQSIELKDLLVNRANDRHGEVVDESAAIEWLLTHRSNHMRNLAKDVVASGEIFEPPLVRKENEHYVVYDGNRRTTVLKLLANPQLSPSQDWAKFFTDLRANWEGDFPSKIQCQIEQDRERLDEILYRRHTGQQSGVGQSQWDAPAKTNFERRTGKNTRLDIAEVVEDMLIKSGRLRDGERIPRSNMKRLFSAEHLRNRAGITVEKNKLRLTHKEDKVLSALERIARDLISKKKTLDDLWDNDAKRKYLDELDRERILPTVEDALKEKKPIDAPKPAQPENGKGTPQPRAPQPEKRKTLIRDIDYGIQQTHVNKRALDIFYELQHKLKFDDHDNAIAVLFRVLLEIGIEQYIEQKKVGDVHKGDKLSNKFRKVLAHMFDNGLIEDKYQAALRKFEKSEILFSTSTLHSYVHSADFFPSDQHLKSMWDTLDKFVVICLKS